MTASQIARLLHGKRVGHGKYLAKCPAHPDKTPSLSIRDGKDAVLLKCWPGCSVKDIVSAMGLKMTDLWYSTTTVMPEVSERLKDERRLEIVYMWQAASLWNMVHHEGFKEEWEASYEAYCCEEAELTFRLFPDRKQAYDLQVRTRSTGWDQIWKEFWQENLRLERANPIVQELQTSLF